MGGRLVNIIVGYDVPCPDCRDGRPIVTIEVECSCACHRLHSKYPGLAHDVIGECRRDGSCRDGTITHRLTASEMLPIRDPYNPLPTGERWVVLSPSGNAALVGEYGAALNIALPAAATPGMFVAIGTLR